MKRIRSEADVMSTWRPSADQRPLVSICCAVYNHETYIRDCLDGFILQVTSFPFEILINDDASTDNSADIIREYEARYPRLIKPIYQSENQYSKNLPPNIWFTFPRAVGDFISICEGDDFWTSRDKLQHQYDVSKQYPGVDLFFGPARLVYGSHSLEESKTRLTGWHGNQSKLIDLEEVVRQGGGAMPTTTLFLRTSSLKSLIDQFKYTTTCDYAIQIFGSRRGGALYHPKVTSVYRLQALGSVSSSHTSFLDIEKVRRRYENMQRGYALVSVAMEAPTVLAAVRYRLSIVHYNAALSFLLLGYEAEFQKAINQSWSENQLTSFGQSLLFCFQNFIGISKLVARFIMMRRKK